MKIEDAIKELEKLRDRYPGQEVAMHIISQSDIERHIEMEFESDPYYDGEATPFLVEAVMFYLDDFDEYEAMPCLHSEAMSDIIRRELREL